MRIRAAENGGGGRPARAAEWLALAGFLVYAMAAPHSIAGAWMGVSVAVLAWLLRALATRRTGFRRTPLDLPLWLLLVWTAASSFLSYEPQLSVPKLVNATTFLMFYLAQSLLTRRTAVTVAALMIASGVAGVLWSLGEVALGRGVIVRELRADSPLRSETLLSEGDAVWRVNGRRVSSVEEIDEAIRRTPAGGRVTLSVISRGEHVEWPGPFVTEEMRRADSPSGVVGGGRTHRFRASGWTRHYGTHAEMLQMVAQFALGFAIAGLRRRPTEGAWRRSRLLAALPLAAFALLAVGLALTAMRTVIVAFAVGAVVLLWRAAAGGRTRALVVAFVLAALSLGALAVSRTRASGALLLRDSSADRRAEVARIAASRIPLHPFFGHGMDASHRHWREWGFAETGLLHAHSTPLQLAFDRGLPALLFWLWLMLVFWRQAWRAERRWRDSEDAAAHGLALGVTGALAGFLASSLVNYNFGDAEVALLVWWMMGATVGLTAERGNNGDDFGRTYLPKDDLV